MVEFVSVQLIFIYWIFLPSADPLSGLLMYVHVVSCVSVCELFLFSKSCEKFSNVICLL